MSEKRFTTYFLGAGASANALPTVKDMHERMWVFNEMMKVECQGFDLFYPYDKLKTLLHESIRVGTPDTLARAFYINGDSRLTLWKKFPTGYFMFEQISEPDFDRTAFSIDQLYDNSLEKYQSIRNGIRRTDDQRYTKFLTTCFEPHLNSHQRIRSDIRIITWNYDIQVPRNLAFLNRIDISSVFRSLMDEGQYSLPFVTYLNGYAGYAPSRNNEGYFFPPDKKDFLNWLSESLSPNHRLLPELNFSWEKNRVDGPYSSEARNAQKILEQSKRVIIIGYSFPDFNRRVDAFIFNTFHGDIIIEESEATNIGAELLLLLPKEGNVDWKKKMITKSNYTQFYVPEEFKI